MGKRAQRASTSERIWSALPAKSRAAMPIHRAISAISGSRKPREVTAGVPTRMPLVTKGFSGSLGMAFLLTVIWTSSSRCSSSLPVLLFLLI